MINGFGKMKEYNGNDILIKEGEYLNGVNYGEAKEYGNNGQLNLKGTI